MEKIFTEPLETTDPVRSAYIEGLNRAIDLLLKAAEPRRRAFVTPESMAKDREGYRRAYADMIGLTRLREVFGNGVPEMKEVYVGEDELCKISRLTFTLAEGVTVHGLLLRPRNAEAKAPLVIACHGGGGTPELCSDMLGKNNYNGMVRRVLARGAVVYAPQMILWNFPNIEEQSFNHTQYDRKKLNGRLMQAGATIAGFEIYGITRALNKLTLDSAVDANRIGMLGLSYGGFYTLYTMAAEPRIRSGYSAGFFNDRTAYAWVDCVWMDSASKFLDQEVAGLCAPRRLLLEVGKHDPVFDNSKGNETFAPIPAYFRAANAEENVRFNLWDGGHTVSDGNESLDFFFEGINQ